jgi:hypothetical protein
VRFPVRRLDNRSRRISPGGRQLLVARRD